MNHQLKIILLTFTRQSDSNDCGKACLYSIFKYSGISVPEISNNGTQQYSLLQLNILAREAGLESDCVKMDLAALKENRSPCILHIFNNAGEPHFIVHYPFSLQKGFHLIGDPDRNLLLISETALLEMWSTRSALYFENLKPANKFHYHFFPWNTFGKFQFIPGILWFSVPFLNVVAASLGLAFSIIIQKAMEPDFIHSRHGFFVVLFILLGIILFAKSILNYLRQWIMITVASRVNSKLSEAILGNAYNSFKSSNKLANHFYLNTVSDLQKINQAVALLVGVALSDGILIMLMLGGIYYYLPGLIVIQVLTFLSLLTAIDWFLPLMMISFDNSPIASSDKMRAQANPPGAAFIDYDAFTFNFSKINEDFSKKSNAMSALVNKINLWFEIIQAISTISVVIYSLNKLQADFISYEGFLMSILLCYGMNLLMNKICNQLFVIAEGAQRLKQNLTGQN